MSEDDKSTMIEMSGEGLPQLLETAAEPPAKKIRTNSPEKVNVLLKETDDATAPKAGSAGHSEHPIQQDGSGEMKKETDDATSPKAGSGESVVETSARFPEKPNENKSTPELEEKEDSEPQGMPIPPIVSVSARGGRVVEVVTLD